MDRLKIELANAQKKYDLVRAKAHQMRIKAERMEQEAKRVYDTERSLLERLLGDPNGSNERDSTSPNDLRTRQQAKADAEAKNIGIKKAILLALPSMPREFDMTALKAAVELNNPSLRPHANSWARVMSDLVADGAVFEVEKGRGRRPSRFSKTNEFMGVTTGNDSDDIDLDL